MIVELVSSLFDDNSKFQKLNHLFIFFEIGKHKLYLEDDISESEWILSNMHLKSFCELGYKDSVYIPKKDIQLKIESDNNLDYNIYSLEDGYVFLENNLIIFVENASSDRLFLNALFKNLLPESKRINDAISNRWLNIIGPGGKNEIIKAINNELRRYRGEKSPNDIFLRAIVIIDSDKKHPNDEIGSEQKKIVEYCLEKSIDCHILAKREIENYVPNESFENLLSFPVSVEYIKLTNEQSSFYDLEKGFGNKNLNTLDVQIQTLFKSIGEKEEGILRKGFISIDKFSPKKEIPNLFKHKNTNRKTLIDKCSNNELLDIIDKINQFL